VVFPLLKSERALLSLSLSSLSHTIAKRLHLQWGKAKQKQKHTHTSLLLCGGGDGEPMQNGRTLSGIEKQKKTRSLRSHFFLRNARFNSKKQKHAAETCLARCCQRLRLRRQHSGPET